MKKKTKPEQPAPMYPTEGLARPKDVAKFLTVAAKTVCNMLAAGDLPSVRISEGTIRTFWEDVRSHVKSRRKEAVARSKAN